MKAILAREFGGPDVLKLEEVPDPAAGTGQVRVRIHAVGVNPYDTYMRAGGYAISPALPFTPGADAAGVIDQVGDGGTGWHAGDRVYISGTALGKAHGAYAALAVCEVGQVHRLPARISFAQGAGLFVPYVTAWRALFGRANARAGDTVLVHGASGGVGVAATQFAVAAGLTVIGTAGTDEGLKVVTAQGAHHAFNHRGDGYLDRIASVTGGRGPDVILEMLANVNLDHDLTIVAPGGRVVVIGNRGRVEIDARKIMSKDCAVYGLALWGIPPDEVRRAHQAIIAGLESGALNPVVGREMPLADAARAHIEVMEPGAHGKIVLIP
ncbi:MAG: NADPH:quinone reductase [Vicinamibacterales bacterium]|jgi:NADPH2:quinone reductase